MELICSSMIRKEEYVSDEPAIAEPAGGPSAEEALAICTAPSWPSPPSTAGFYSWGPPSSHEMPTWSSSRWRRKMGTNDRGSGRMGSAGWRRRVMAFVWVSHQQLEVSPGRPSSSRQPRAWGDQHRTRTGHGGSVKLHGCWERPSYGDLLDAPARGLQLPPPLLRFRTGDELAA